MLLKNEREEIVAYGKKLITQGLTKGTGGNISVYNRQKGLLAISPSGLDYFRTEPDDVPVLTIEKVVLEGARKPSSELDLHMIFYKKREDLNAIVHTHSVYATTLACLQWEIPALHYLIGFAGKSVKCAAYATFGTEALGISAFEAMIDRKAVLLAQHGLLAGGSTLQEAFSIAETIEFCAEIYCRAKMLGEPVVLSDEEMDTIIEKFKTYGK
ncbi:MAG: L-fuculose-phosphate aldolase [Pseudomonadota bacterium]